MTKFKCTLPARFIAVIEVDADTAEEAKELVLQQQGEMKQINFAEFDFDEITITKEKHLERAKKDESYFD